jgi:pimeloyl-ACP methyl ester carboxylesterase
METVIVPIRKESRRPRNAAQRGYRYWRQLGRPVAGPPSVTTRRPVGTTVLKVSEPRISGQRVEVALDDGSSRLFVHGEAHRRTRRTQGFFNFCVRPGAKVSEGVRESFWLQGMMAGFPAAYYCIKAFSETDQTEDLKHIDVPTLIIQGDDDQIVPFVASGQLQSKLVRGATLKIYKGAPHGLCTTHKHQVNEDLLASLRS